MERKMQKSKMADAEALRTFSRVVEQTQDSVVITDRQGTLEYVNPYFEELTGYTAEEVLGKKTSLLKSGTHDGKFYRKLWPSYKKESLSYPMDSRERSPPGKDRCCTFH